jgi:2-polyprenyl-3-methyl-5-hydroxy-6-metoxy-1,4-benzoquinol methylase/spore coat polysaccharide biosynthesis predicted glycosyltransferase SpsG
LIPSTIEGNGIGHIKRMLSLSKELDEDTYLYINKEDRLRLSPIFEDYEKTNIIDELKDLDSYKKIVIDLRNLEIDFFEQILKGHNTIAIDEGGVCREKIPYLIDILPLPDRFSSPNIRSLSFLSFPEIIRREKNNKILVSFGGEDPAKLTEKFCEQIKTQCKELISRLTIVLGPIYKGNIPDSQFEVLHSPSSLYGVLPSYSGVICSFGITAFEANHLEIPVLMVNPGDYHEELSRISGFTSAGITRGDMNKIKQFIINPSSLKLVEIDSDESSLSTFIHMIDEVDVKCPVCSNNSFLVQARFKWRTFNRCSHCGMLYMLNFNKNKIKYDKEYFFNQYENQYGKTYLDDFDHISDLSEERLNIIGKITGKKKNILDVGCAYGPFIKKAFHLGYFSFGTDISDDAVSYVKNELNINALCCEFDKFKIPKTWNIEYFDILTMWYVIEHFEDLGSILKRVNTLLKIGGVFAFSTPNGSGISSRNNQNDFLYNSPDDHYTIWEPHKSSAILNLFGFKLVKIRITGHHPERFHSFLKKTEFGRRILRFKSRLFKMGDTFVIYAKKEREL